MCVRGNLNEGRKEGRRNKGERRLGWCVCERQSKEGGGGGRSRWKGERRLGWCV